MIHYCFIITYGLSVWLLKQQEIQSDQSPILEHVTIGNMTKHRHT